MDHESYLGDTLAQIAFEKAGILKPGVPAVLGPQQPEALAVIEARAAAVGAPLAASTAATGRWRRRRAASRRDRGRERLDLPRPALAGVHQIDNAGLAVVAALPLSEAGLDRRGDRAAACARRAGRRGCSA